MVCEVMVLGGVVVWGELLFVCLVVVIVFGVFVVLWMIFMVFDLWENDGVGFIIVMFGILVFVVVVII